MGNWVLWHVALINAGDATGTLSNYFQLVSKEHLTKRQKHCAVTGEQQNLPRILMQIIRFQSLKVIACKTLLIFSSGTPCTHTDKKTRQHTFWKAECQSRETGAESIRKLDSTTTAYCRQSAYVQIRHIYRPKSPECWPIWLQFHFTHKSTLTQAHVTDSQNVRLPVYNRLIETLKNASKVKNSSTL